MNVRSIRVPALILAVSLLIGCAQSVSGQASVDGGRANAAATGPTLAPHSGSGGHAATSTSATRSSPPSTSSTTTRTAATTASTGPDTVTSTDTTTEYTTVFDTAPVTGGPGGPPAPGPADVIGSPTLGPDASGFVNFQSPSGNIMCALITSSSNGGARCDIADFHYTAPTGPDCGVTGWHGGTASVGDSGVGSVGGCIGDTVANPANPVLPYGQNAGNGDYGCHSAENGVTCANLLTRHGFRLSRDSYQAF